MPQREEWEEGEVKASPGGKGGSRFVANETRADGGAEGGATAEGRGARWGRGRGTLAEEKAEVEVEAAEAEAANFAGAMVVEVIETEVTTDMSVCWSQCCRV